MPRVLYSEKNCNNIPVQGNTYTNSNPQTQCESKLSRPEHKAFLSFSYDFIIEYAVSAFPAQGFNV